MVHIKRKVIGIIAQRAELSINFSLKQGVSYIGDSYIDLIEICDAIPYVIPYYAYKTGDISKILDIIDGLILTGGQDIHPECYGESMNIEYTEGISGFGNQFHRPLIAHPNIERDKFEIDLYLSAIKFKIPVIGICRGMQLINVAHGGQLYQEVPQSNVDHFINDDGFINYHAIEIREQSRIFDIMKVKSYFTSSIHHQAVKRLGEGLSASAVAEDDIVEIIEHKNSDIFVIGIQGHPEKTMNNLSKYKMIFEKFKLAMQGGK